MRNVRLQMFRIWRTLVVALLVMWPLAACDGGTGETGGTATNASAAIPSAATTASPTGTKLNVVVTYSILGDLVQNVAGDRVNLRVLVLAGGDAHTFEPSPADGVALADAQFVFGNGLAFEPWLDALYAASGSQGQRIAVTAEIDAITAEEGEAQDEHGEFDPHMWHDVRNVIRMVERIRDVLVTADQANAATYQANAQAYLTQLQELDDYVVQQVATLPQAQRKLVTTHDTFAYFARRYGFEVIGTALGSASTEVADPAAADLARLVDEIKVVGVPAIFTENIESGSLTERVAREAGVELAPPLYTDALGEPGSSGATYLAMVRYNIDTIVTALSK